MTRCLVVEQMVHAGFTISTIAFILNRTVQAIRHLLKMSNDYYESSRAFRLSTSEATLQHANYVVEHIEDYKNQITKCEEVLKELNPQFAKDKARDERIAGIENEVAGMKGDIAKILAAVTKN